MKLRRPLHTIVIPLVGVAVMLTSCGYLQMNPPPDVEMEEGEPYNTAWLAAASNMLAAAGYGNGKSPQEKASNIYAQMTGYFGTTNPGWTDAALQWWLQSEYNRWPGNRYKLVTVEGYKVPSLPWDRIDGANIIARRLRSGHYLAASISWPGTPDNPYGKGGHVLNCWGDDLKEKNLSQKTPGHLRVTDSYKRTGGIIHTYPYDPFDLPNPDGMSAGKGWYIAYDENHPFIRNVVSLSPVSSETEMTSLARYTVSLRTYNETTEQASGISYILSASKPLLDHNSAFMPGNRNTIGIKDRVLNLPVINDRSVSVFDLPRNSVGQDQSLTLFSSFVSVPSSWITMEKITFLYERNEKAGMEKAISFRLYSPRKEWKEPPANPCGGYLLGAFQAITSTDSSNNRPCEIRFIEQYPFDFDPAKHRFEMICDSGTCITNIRFGHSYGWIGEDSLWNHEKWTTFISDTLLFEKEIFLLDIDWNNLLPYPKSEGIEKAARTIPQ